MQKKKNDFLILQLNTSTNAHQTTQACILLQQIQHKQNDVQGKIQNFMVYPYPLWTNAKDFRSIKLSNVYI